MKFSSWPLHETKYGAAHHCRQLVREAKALTGMLCKVDEARTPRMVKILIQGFH
jgi:hypothetical protein